MSESYLGHKILSKFIKVKNYIFGPTKKIINYESNISFNIIKIIASYLVKPKLIAQEYEREFSDLRQNNKIIQKDSILYNSTNQLLNNTFIQLQQLKNMLDELDNTESNKTIYVCNEFQLKADILTQAYYIKKIIYKN